MNGSIVLLFKQKVPPDVLSAALLITKSFAGEISDLFKVPFRGQVFNLPQQGWEKHQATFASVIVPPFDRDDAHDAAMRIRLQDICGTHSDQMSQLLGPLPQDWPHHRFFVPSQPILSPGMPDGTADVLAKAGIKDELVGRTISLDVTDPERVIGNHHFDVEYVAVFETAVQMMIKPKIIGNALIVALHKTLGLGIDHLWWLVAIFPDEDDRPSVTCRCRRLGQAENLQIVT